MSEVSSFINNLPDNQKSLMMVLDEWIMDFPRITSKIRYHVPFYYRKSWICYINPIKKDGVELVFLRGNELSNFQGILDAKGRKQVAGVEIFDHFKVPFTELSEVLNEALILDQTVPYASKRKPV